MSVKIQNTARAGDGQGERVSRAGATDRHLMGPSGEGAAAAHGALVLQVDALPLAAMPTAATASAAAMSSSSSKALDDEQHNHQHSSSSHAASTQEPDTVIYFRKIVADDIAQVRELHETWFPIRYNQVRPYVCLVYMWAALMQHGDSL